MPEITKEEMLNAKKEVAAALDAMVAAFYRCPSADNFYEVCQGFVLSYNYNLGIYVPMDIEEGGFVQRFEYVPGHGYCYTAYTTLQEATGTDRSSIGVVRIRDYFRRVNDDPNSGGLIINPEHKAENTALLFLNKENIRSIVRIAESSIQEHEEPLRSALLALE